MAAITGTHKSGLGLEPVIIAIVLDLDLINKRHGSQTLQQTIWLWNHKSHTKIYFNEFVANVLRDNMGMIIFDLWGCGGC